MTPYDIIDYQISMLSCWGGGVSWQPPNPSPFGHVAALFVTVLSKHQGPVPRKFRYAAAKLHANKYLGQDQGNSSSKEPVMQGIS